MEYENGEVNSSTEYKQLKTLKQSVYIMLSVLVIVSAAFGLLYKLSRDDMIRKEIKISAIISEVGEVKNDLEISQRSINKLYDELGTTKSLLDNLSYNVVRAAAEKEVNWQNVKNELDGARQHLDSLLEQKESVISDLARKNEIMKQEMNLNFSAPEGSVNALILGHNAGLVDTVMLASANPDTREITLISIPRDLYHKGRKINELYHAYGIEELQKAAYEITGVYPDKYILFSLDSFVDFIDQLGGITVNVERDITDMSYPGPDSTYTTVSFKAGIQQMDGKTALKYARSRKSTSDFDRAKRQQQIISAVKDKALGMDLLSQLDLASKIYATVSANIESNISLFDSLGYLQNFKDYSVSGGNVLSTSNLLYSTVNARGQYILLPSGDNYVGIKQYVSDLLSE